MIALDLLSVKMGDAGSYECLVKPYDGAAVSAIVNFTVYGKRSLLFVDTHPWSDDVAPCSIGVRLSV